MKIRHSIVIAGAVLAFAPAAFAGDTADKSCTTLQEQFDNAIAAAQSDRVGEAQSLRDEGGKLCAEGEYDQGASKIKEALTLLQDSAPPKAS